jgi:PAS domain S-box-containing protein
MTTVTSAPPLDSSTGPTTWHPDSRLSTTTGPRSTTQPVEFGGGPSRPRSRRDPPADAPAAAVCAATALAYGIVGWLSLALAIPPGYASPMYPAAGIALACTMVFGWPAALGAALGSLAVNLGLQAERGTLDAAALGVPAAIALGVALQALLGVALLRRVVRLPTGLTEPREIVRFLLIAAASCVISASVGNLALLARGDVAALDLPLSWLTWFVGDALGALIGAPVTLTLIGRPRADWVVRRVSVGLPLALATLVMAAAIGQVEGWDSRQAREAAENDARRVGAALQTQLEHALHALEAVRGALLVAPGLDRAGFASITAPWLAPGSPVATIAWFERVTPSQIAGFEAATRAEGRAELSAFRVFDRRTDRDPAAVPTERRDDAFPMRFVEPLGGNAGALGVNLMSIPAARSAALRSASDGRAAATDAFTLTQDSDARRAVAVYGAVRADAPAGTGRSLTTARGYVSVAMRLDDLVAPAQALAPGGQPLCLIDTDAQGPARVLHGDPACETASAAGPLQTAMVEFAGQPWQLMMRPAAGTGARPTNVWLFAMLGLLATAMFGALMLIVTGRTRRIEGAVRARTAQLEAQARERARAEAALRESEQRFRNILNTVPIGVVYSDLSGQIRQANPKFCELLGYSAEELVQRRTQDLTDAQDHAEEMQLSVRLVRGEIPGYRVNKRYLARDGRRVWVRSVVSALRDESGQPRRIVGIAEDITEQLRLAEAERARETAEAANQAKSEFLSRMSHELRTPLNAMLGFAQLLELDQRSPLSDTQRPWVAQMQQAGWHLLEMINDVLDLSRIESGTLRLQVAPVSLREAADASLALIERDARRRQLSVAIRLDPSCTRVLGDLTRVKQILTNLLTNAVKYNRDGGRIELTSRRSIERDRIEIVVTDTGLGMTPEQLDHLFEPFNRLGRERTNAEGTGIGLVISRRLAELMSGTLVARSAAGSGSTFVLTLPRAESATDIASKARETVDDAAGYHRRRVHYIEDNETNVEVMRGILSQRPQVELEVSVTAEAGLSSVRARRPDLILLDMHLPDLHGLEVLAELRRDPALCTVPVIVVSADAMAGQIEAAKAAGAAAYLTKPVSVSELLREVDQRLDAIDTGFGAA